MKSYFEFLEKTLSASMPCDYWDVRIEQKLTKSFRMENHILANSTNQSSLGAFIRVRKSGSWFYKSTTNLDSIVDQARELCKLPALEGKVWDKNPPNLGHTSLVKFKDSYFETNNLENKLSVLRAFDQELVGIPKIGSSFVSYADTYLFKSYANSVGTIYEYDHARYGLSLDLVFKDGEKIFGDLKNFYGNSLDELSAHLGEVKKYFAEAPVFLEAPHVDPGNYRVVIDQAITGTFVHESFGHMSEADAMYLDAKAKESWKLGMSVANPLVNLVDSGVHAGSGYCPIDDEGYPAQINYLIKNGILVGRLHNHDTADAMKEAPTGNGRSISFEYEPIVRMTGTYIENGNTPVSELIKRAEGGLYLKDYNHGAGGETFTIAPIRGYKIENGKLIPARVNVISGHIFETLKNIEALGNDFMLESSNFGGCGKFGQWPLSISSGGPTLLVSSMQVG